MRRVSALAAVIALSQAYAAHAQYPDSEYQQPEYQEPGYQEVEPRDDDEPESQDADYDAWDYAYQAPRTPAEIQRSVEDEVSTPKYRFCNDPEYVLHTRERPYCPLAKAAEPVCPEFDTACARPEQDDRGDWGMSGSFGGDGNKRGGRMREQPREREAREETPTWNLPEGLVGLFRILFWLVVAALGVAIISLLVSAWTKSARERRDEADAAPDEQPSGAERGAVPSVVESDVARLLARARAHAQAAHYGAAVDDLYAALLRHLEGEQLLVLQRHRTNGDYVRALREHPHWQRLLQECGRDVERAQFGTKEADATTFTRLLGRIEPVLTRAVVAALCVLGSLGPLGCSGEDERTSQERQWGALADTSPRGLALFRALLEEEGYEVRHRVRRVATLDEQTGMLVVYDDTSLEDEDWQALDRWVQQGHELWLAGDPEAAAHFGGKSSFVECAPPVQLEPAHPGERTRPATDGSERPLELSSVSGTLAPSERLEPLISCSSGPMVSRLSVGDGTVTFFADIAPLTNAALVSADNAVALLAMLQAWPKTVEFAGGLTGQGAESPYEALLNAKLGPVLLQIALLMLVWYLAHGIPFATLRDPPEAGRRRFLDHLVALGRVFQRAGARQHALHHYAAWALGRLNERVRPGQRMSIIELGTALAKRTGKPQSEVLETLAEAATARNQPDRPVSGDELKVQRRLEALVIEIGGNK